MIPASEILPGYCQCGCGQKTNIAKKTDNSRDRIKGMPLRFCYAHNLKDFQSGENHPNWKGGPAITGCYPKTFNQIDEHILLAEKALGKPLPLGAKVHHHGLIINQCIVICQDDAYHKFIEQRTKAWFACGHADWRKCWICNQYDDPINLYIHNSIVFHNKCFNERQRKYRTARRQ
ncbi:MAG: hypothetical protein ACLQBD_11485 [Syntrophobacteraceae bacterium]